MSTNKPTPSQMLAAFKDHGVDFKTYKNWDTRGGTWGAYGGGLDGVVNHHTSTASAKGSSGCPTLYWCAETYDWAISNMVVGRGPGDTYFLSAKPSYHSGDGGPWKSIGINQAGNTGHLQLFGIEIDDAGVSTSSLTDYQIQNVARINAALWDLCGWPDSSRIVTHGCWTNGCHGVNPNGPSPWLGRKNDTLEGWGAYPGDPNPKHYNAPFWRQEAEKYLIKNETWDGTIPRRSAAQRAFDDRELANQAAWRLACKLYDIGFRDKPSLPNGEQRYPSSAVKDFQKSVGLSTDAAPTKETWIKLFGKDKP